MHQIDQDPGGYRVQASDGSWQQRVNKPLCRWLGVACLVFMAYGAFQYWTEGGNPTTVLFATMMGFFAGGLITLSLKSLNW